MPENHLSLGTVQFGLNYGIANQSGQVGREEASGILQEAWASGINMLDTAIVYGESEQVLGEIGISGWDVVSKLPFVPSNCSNVMDWVFDCVEGSLERLKIDCFYGLLLHRPEQLHLPFGEELYGALRELKKQGLVWNIGLSIYNPEELDTLIDTFQVDIVQAPFNIIDRRLQTSGWLSRLHEENIEVHVRSIFLQGLLLMDQDMRPKKFSRWQTLWHQWHSWLRETGLTPLQACLGFALAYPEVDRVVFGVDSVNQLKEILAAADTKIPIPPVLLETNDLDLIIPSRWESLTS